MNRTVTILGCLALLGLGTAPSAGAQEFGAFDGFPISKLEIRGVPRAVGDELEAGLALAGQTVRLRREYPAFDAAKLAADRDRIRLFLQRRGYPRARVAARVEPVDRARRVAVTFEIDPGSPVALVEIAFEGLPPGVERRVNREIELRAGTRFEDAGAVGGARAAEIALRRAGYAKASVTPRVESLDSTRVRLVYVVAAGPRNVFGATRVEGLPDDLAPVAARAVGIDPGDAYTPRALDDAKDNLRNLDLFRQIRLATAPGRGDTLDVVAALSLRDPHTIETKIGYLSEDKLRTRVSWEGRNTFGGGRGLQLLGSYSIYNQEARIATWWPALLSPRTREEFSLTAHGENEDAYNYWDVGLMATTSHRRSLRTTTNLSLYFGYVDARFVSEEEDDLTGWMPVVMLNQAWDRTDDRLRPTRGWLAWGKAEWAPETGITEAPYVLGQVGGSHYAPLPLRSVLATRLAVGLADPLGQTRRLLPNRRFYAGGANSNRGFQRRMLGPRDEAGNPIGGEASLELQAEIRFPLLWRFQGAAFFDVGQVWSTVEGMKLDSLQPSAGYAVMIDSPVGPIRGDIGYRLRDPGNDAAHVFHFLIGHPF